MNDRKCFIYAMATAAGKEALHSNRNGVFYVLSFIFVPFLFAAFLHWTSEDEQKSL